MDLVETLERPEGKTLDFKRDLLFGGAAGQPRERPHQPRIIPEIEILPWRRTQVMAVHVHPSPSRPHHLTREGPAAGVYVRVGSTNRRADAELVEELRRFARGEGFDEKPMPDLDSEALDFRAASESFAPVRALTRRDLDTLRLVTEHQGRKVPTGAGLPAPAFQEIAAEIGLSARATRTRLARLVGRGLVREIGTGPQDPRRRYYLADGGPA